MFMYTTEENKVTCLISFIYMTNYQNDLKMCAGIKKKIQLWENEFTVCSSHSGIRFIMI